MEDKLNKVERELTDALLDTNAGEDVQPRRKPGGLPGNQNARKRGVHRKALTREQRNLLRAARRAGGQSHEVALLRFKVSTILADPHADMDLVLRAMRILIRMINTDRRNHQARDG